MSLYTVFQSDDGLWRVKFRKDIAKRLCIGKFASHIIQVSSESLADELAGMMVKGSLTAKPRRARKPLTVQLKQADLF